MGMMLNINAVLQQICHRRLKFCHLLILRTLTSRPPPLTHQQASMALRPFYFAVHPDRFVQEPIVRQNNEKSLQIFNGYVNNLFPRPGIFQTPIQVEFSIRGKDRELRNIRISLAGHEVEPIIRSALEQCELSTDGLPKTSSSSVDGDHPSCSSWSTRGLDEMWQHLQERERLRRCGARSVDNLFSDIRINRDDALHRMENHRRIMELIRDEIEHIIRRTGITQIVWSINWDQSHMRRCLLNVQSMIGHADQEVREMVIHALNGRKLIFGRGSHICSDGSLQFGADDATGAWQKVCIESTVRRFDVRNLELLVERVRELLGGVQLVVRPYVNVLNSIQQMQIFIGKICSQPMAERDALKCLLTPDLSVEIVNCYHELVVVEGCLQIPCCVEFGSFKNFILDNGVRSRQLRQDHFERKWQLELAKDGCVKALSLDSLSWDGTIPFDTLTECMAKMRRLPQEKADTLAQLGVHLSSNSKIFVMSNGFLSLPIDWLNEL